MGYKERPEGALQGMSNYLDQLTMMSRETRKKLLLDSSSALEDKSLLVCYPSDWTINLCSEAHGVSCGLQNINDDTKLWKQMIAEKSH